MSVTNAPLVFLLSVSHPPEAVQLRALVADFAWQY